MGDDEHVDDVADDNENYKPTTRKRRSVTPMKSNGLNDSQDVDVEPNKKRRSTTSKATSALNSRKKLDVVGDVEIEGASVSTKKVKPPAHQVITDKDEIPKLWNDEKATANGSYSKFYLKKMRRLLSIYISNAFTISIQDSIVECCWITSRTDEITECIC